VARPLAQQITQLGVRVWLDENELELGDSLRETIDHGLANSRFGIVILSPAFFSKNWPQQELNGLTARETAEGKVILPVWYNVDEAYVHRFSPTPPTNSRPPQRQVWTVSRRKSKPSCADQQIAPSRVPSLSNHLAAARKKSTAIIVAGSGTDEQFAATSKVRFAIEQSAEAVTEERVIVQQKYANFRHARLCHRRLQSWVSAQGRESHERLSLPAGYRSGRDCQVL